MSKGKAVAKVEPKQQVEKMHDDNIDNVYTYVGGGEDSPRFIELMGVKFIRGKGTPVNDEAVLAKIKNNPTFVNGTVEEEELHEYDAKAKAEADIKRAHAIKMNKAYSKKHRTE